MSSRIAVTEDGLVQASPLDRTYIGGHAQRNGHSTYASGPAAAAAVDAVGDEYYCVEAREAPHAEVIGVRAEERYSCCSRIRCIVTWLWKCVITTWAYWAVFYVGGVFVWIVSFFVIWFMFGVDFYDTSKWAAFVSLVYLLFVSVYFFFDVYETGCFGLYEKERRQDGQDSASANASAGANSTNRSKLARFLLACRCCRLLKCVTTTWAYWAVFWVGGVFVWIVSFFVIWFMFGLDSYDAYIWAGFITLVYLLLVTGYFFFDVYETGCFGLYEKERRQDGQDSASANANAGANSTNRSKLARFLLACRCCRRVWVYIFAFWVGSGFFFIVFFYIFRSYGYSIIPTAIYDCCLLYYLYKESKSTGCFGLRDPNQPDIEMQAGAAVGNRDNGQMVVVDATPVHATAIITVTAPAPVPTATLRIPSFNP
jgi:hypothetical protein